MLKIDLQLFGGRGASSGGKGGSGAKGRTQREHEEKWGEPPSKAKQLADRNGISLSDADDQVTAIKDYSGTDYSEIRAAQYNGNTNSMYYDQAQAIEAYIAQSPTWDGGNIYRGIKMDADSFSQMQVGGRIDMRGLSSWSSDEQIAHNFAQSYGTKKSVVFRSKGTKQGASITHLSKFGTSESEVLVSGKATWTIKKITKVGNITYVDVKED